MLASRLLRALAFLTPTVLAVGVLVLLARPPEPVVAQVISSTVRETDSGFTGNVRWADDQGTVSTKRLELSAADVGAGTIHLVVGDEVRPFDATIGTRLPRAVLGGTALLTLLFTTVVVLSSRGFGFVRGTGQPGEMTSTDVRESRAFYWRH